MTADVTAQKLKMIKAILPPYLFKGGCTEQRIEALRQAQDVYCLPELFRQLLLLIGEEGLGRLLFFEDRVQNLEDVKGEMIDQLASAELDYPEDIFFFHGNRVYDVYLFFRTRDCEDDPTVYSVGATCFFKEADTFSEFILNIFEPDQERTQARREKVSKANHYYNPSRDEFYNLSIPAETIPRIEKAREIVIHQVW